MLIIKYNLCESRDFCVISSHVALRSLADDKWWGHIRYSENMYGWVTDLLKERISEHDWSQTNTSSHRVEGWWCFCAEGSCICPYFTIRVPHCSHNSGKYRKVHAHKLLLHLKNKSLSFIHWWIELSSYNIWVVLLNPRNAVSPIFLSLDIHCPVVREWCGVRALRKPVGKASKPTRESQFFCRRWWAGWL